MYLRFDAGHTPTGNPQRVFVVFDDSGEIVEVIDEGYAGLPRALRDVPGGYTFATSKMQYRELLKLGKELASRATGHGRW
jgi:hypothetical protein